MPCHGHGHPPLDHPVASILAQSTSRGFLKGVPSFIVHSLGREHLPATKEILGLDPITPASSMTCRVLAFGEGTLVRGRAYRECEQYRCAGSRVRVREG